MSHRCCCSRSDHVWRSVVAEEPRGKPRPHTRGLASADQPRRTKSPPTLWCLETVQKRGRVFAELGEVTARQAGLQGVRGGMWQWQQTVRPTCQPSSEPRVQRSCCWGPRNTLSLPPTSPGRSFGPSLHTQAPGQSHGSSVLRSVAVPVAGARVSREAPGASPGVQRGGLRHPLSNPLWNQASQPAAAAGSHQSKGHG